MQALFSGSLELVFASNFPSRALIRLRMGPVTSLSAGPKRSRLGPGPPCPGQTCRQRQLLQRPELSADNADCLLLARPGPEGRWEDPPSDKRESWTRPKEGSLLFLLVLGVMPCRALLVAISASTKVEMPFFGFLGPVLAGPQRRGALGLRIR